MIMQSQVTRCFVLAVKQRLESESITQAELASWCLEEGLTERRIKQILVGKTAVDRYELIGIAEALGLDDFLWLAGVGGEENSAFSGEAAQ